MTTPPPTKFNLRTQHEKDKPWCLGSWYRNCYDNAPRVKDVPVPVYGHHMNRIIDHHWDNSQWIMLSGDSVRDWMAGFVCGQHTEAATYIHYAYIRERYRGHGYGAEILKAFLGLAPGNGIVYYSTMTNDARSWRRTHLGEKRIDGEVWLGRTWLYNPYALTYNMPEGWYV